MNKEISQLISTMNSDKSLLSKMNLEGIYVAINQINDSKVSDNSILDGRSIWVNINQSGLSKSRNMAIKNCKTKYALICDDDMVYHKGTMEKIVDYFNKNSSYDILIFQVSKENEMYRNYPIKEKSINRLTSMKVSSVEIAFNVDSVNNVNVKFREEFGAGARYSMGEENIFLSECLRKGLRIKYIPFEIGVLTDDRESSWFKGYNSKFFIDQGAVYAMLGKYFSVLLIAQFLIRKRNLYKEAKLNMFQTVKLLFEGRNEIISKV